MKRSILSAAAVLALIPAIATAARTAPAHLANTNATAGTLVARFFHDLTPAGQQDLATFLSPSFIIQRADGTVQTRTDYLAAHPTYSDYTVTVVRAEYAAPVMIVSSIRQGHLLVDGAPVVASPSPALSSYVWTPKGWRITGYARFE